MACTAAAGLLPIIEQVDARRLREFLWRTLALRPPIPGPNGRDGISDLAAPQVAAMAARYDRAIAHQVFHSFADRALSDRTGLEDWGTMFRGDSLFEAAAVVNPARAAEMIASLPDAAGASPGRGLKDNAQFSGGPDPASPRSRPMAHRGVVLATPLANRLGDVLIPKQERLSRRSGLGSSQDGGIDDLSGQTPADPLPTSPKRQRLNAGGDPQSTLWRFGLVIESMRSLCSARQLSTRARSINSLEEIPSHPDVVRRPSPSALVIKTSAERLTECPARTVQRFPCDHSRPCAGCS